MLVSTAREEEAGPESSGSGLAGRWRCLPDELAGLLSEVRAPRLCQERRGRPLAAKCLLGLPQRIDGGKLLLEQEVVEPFHQDGGRFVIDLPERGDNILGSSQMEGPLQSEDSFPQQHFPRPGFTTGQDNQFQLVERQLSDVVSGQNRPRISGNSGTRGRRDLISTGENQAGQQQRMPAEEDLLPSPLPLQPLRVLQPDGYAEVITGMETMGCQVSPSSLGKFLEHSRSRGLTAGQFRSL